MEVFLSIKSTIAGNDLGSGIELIILRKVPIFKHFHVHVEGLLNYKCLGLHYSGLSRGLFKQQVLQITPRCDDRSNLPRIVKRLGEFTLLHA